MGGGYHYEINVFSQIHVGQLLVLVLFWQMEVSKSFEYVICVQCVLEKNIYFIMIFPPF